MNETKKLKGRDLITIGIFSALYFILNLAAMITGFVPVIWLLLLIALVMVMALRFEQISPKAAYLQIPYLIWLCFAAYLNIAIWLLNR